jgi:hypothetical protein
MTAPVWLACCAVLDSCWSRVPWWVSLPAFVWTVADADDPLWACVIGIGCGLAVALGGYPGGDVKVAAVLGALDGGALALATVGVAMTITPWLWTLRPRRTGVYGLRRGHRWRRLRGEPWVPVLLAAHVLVLAVAVWW